MPGNRSRWSWGVFAIVAMAGATLLATWGVRALDPLARGTSAYGRADWRVAEEQARARLKSRPDDLDALRLLARATARRGRDETSEAIYRRLGAKAMEAEDLFLLGHGLRRRGRIGPALAALGAARDADPDHPETLDELSSYWAESGSPLQAAGAAERLARRPGWEARGAVRLARLRRELFDPQGATEVLADALRRDPALTRSGTTPAEARKLLARCLLESGRPAEARGQLSSLPGSATDPEASWLLSRALLQEGHIPEAEAALRSARGFGRNDPLAHEPSPFVGAARCAECHPSQFATEQEGRHARTVASAPALKDLPWPAGPVADPANPRVTHAFRRLGDRVEAETTVEGQTFRALVEYALGSNHQGQTFLAKDEHGEVRELRISRYPGDPHWDRTIEHPAQPPDAPGYLGRPISAESLRRCLHCHATNSREIQEPAHRPDANDRGIGCERCHGPGDNHLRAVAGKFSELAIARPRLAPASRVVALCAQCHKSPGTAESSGPTDIRFQAPGFVRSRCYLEGGDTLSCVTCHDPHRDAGRDPAFYESKCLACHTAGGRPQADGRGVSSTPCPVNPSKDCLRCHMPRVTDAVPRSVFTDHHIRVRRGSPP